LTGTLKSFIHLLLFLKKSCALAVMPQAVHAHETME
jgi:hypothetical protein